MDYHENHHGTAQFADYGMIERAGLYRANQGLFLGLDDRGRILRSDTMAAVLLQGGARSGKGNHIIPWLVDGHYNDHIVSMDWKGQNGSISQLQVLQGRHVINFAPRGISGLVSHRINPLSHLHSKNPNLIPDMKLSVASILPFSGDARAEYFESMAQRWIEAVGVTLVRRRGRLTFPELADAMSLFGGLSDEWMAIEEQMASMPEASILQVVQECQELRVSDNPNAGGAAGAKGELAKAFACMSDPQLRAALSPPFDWCISELTRDDSVPTVFNVMESQEFAQTSASVLKAIYACVLIYKRRSLNARRQVWLWDEVGNIGSWPLAVGMATYAAGLGIRTIFVVQSSAQLNNLAPNAGAIIPNSCGTQIIKGIRSHAEALPVSKSLGTATIEREDFHTNEKARREQWVAFYEAINGREDAWNAAVKFDVLEEKAHHVLKTPRPLRTVDELLSMKDSEAIVSMSGTLERPALVHVPQYWTRRDLAGRYLEDPYHSNAGRVSVAARFGRKTRSVITEGVPAKYAHWPQYSNGSWSYVQGYRPR